MQPHSCYCCCCCCCCCWCCCCCCSCCCCCCCCWLLAAGCCWLLLAAAGCRRQWTLHGDAGRFEQEDLDPALAGGRSAAVSPTTAAVFSGSVWLLRVGARLMRPLLLPLAVPAFAAHCSRCHCFCSVCIVESRKIRASGGPAQWLIAALVAAMLSALTPI